MKKIVILMVSILAVFSLVIGGAFLLLQSLSIRDYKSLAERTLNVPNGNIVVHVDHRNFLSADSPVRDIAVKLSGYKRTVTEPSKSVDGTESNEKKVPYYSVKASIETPETSVDIGEIKMYDGIVYIQPKEGLLSEECTNRFNETGFVTYSEGEEIEKAFVAYSNEETNVLKIALNRMLTAIDENCKYDLEDQTLSYTLDSVAFSNLIMTMYDAENDEYNQKLLQILERWIPTRVMEAGKDVVTPDESPHSSEDKFRNIVEYLDASKIKLDGMLKIHSAMTLSVSFELSVSQNGKSISYTKMVLKTSVDTLTPTTEGFDEEKKNALNSKSDTKFYRDYFIKDIQNNIEKVFTPITIEYPDKNITAFKTEKGVLVKTTNHLYDMFDFYVFENDTVVDLYTIVSSKDEEIIRSLTEVLSPDSRETFSTVEEFLENHEGEYTDTIPEAVTFMLNYCNTKKGIKVFRSSVETLKTYTIKYQKMDDMIKELQGKDAPISEINIKSFVEGISSQREEATTNENV